MFWFTVMLSGNGLYNFIIAVSVDTISGLSLVYLTLQLYGCPNGTTTPPPACPLFQMPGSSTALAILSPVSGGSEPESTTSPNEYFLIHERLVS